MYRQGNERKTSVTVPLGKICLVNGYTTEGVMVLVRECVVTLRPS
jgi:hypothetical protein